MTHYTYPFALEDALFLPCAVAQRAIRFQWTVMGEPLSRRMRLLASRFFLVHVEMLQSAQVQKRKLKTTRADILSPTLPLENRICFSLVGAIFDLQPF